MGLWPRFSDRVVRPDTVEAPVRSPHRPHHNRAFTVVK
ncbi:hypothetical protein BT93_B2761 [Corymbia citriodora subsp. variegata]|nr:hypothetical protein BT93_B2761 [Corymbia citriodora subsp. variegata]